jgi:REP element-mobilizing transposase RayT
MPTIRINKAEIKETYFITFTVIKWVNIFVNEEYFQLIIEVLKHYQKELNLKIYGYVIMTDHIHLVASSNNMIKFIQGFKSYTTRRITYFLNNDHRKYIVELLNPNKRKLFPIWQSTNMPKVIETQKYFNQKLDYIHNNPIKKGYVDTPENWLYSSAKNYFLGDHNLIQIETGF